MERPSQGPSAPTSGDLPFSGGLDTSKQTEKGRLTRLMKKEWGLLGQSGDLTLEDLQKQPKRVGLVHDERMLCHKNEWDDQHPENPGRLVNVYQRCQHYGLVERCLSISPRSATDEEVLKYHSQEYFDVVKTSQMMSRDELMDLSSNYDAVYFNRNTYNAAMLSAGCTIEAVDQVVRGKVRHAMALVRPPGHHAMRNEANGYCIFNNVALAVTHALNDLGLERILIVDWDVHHGQGTQYAFYSDPRVLVFSIHRYEDGLFWPNLRQSNYDFIGEGNGLGFNINMPLREAGMTDGDYIAMLQQILMPVAYEFNPQLVVVSSGYDAAIGDPESGANLVTPAVYAHLTHLVKSLAAGKLCVVLEGGYCSTATSEGAALTLRELLGDPCPLLDPLPPPKPSTVELILQCIRVLGLYWQCFAYHMVTDREEELPDFFKDIELPKQGIEFSTPETRPAKFDLYLDYLFYTDEKVAHFEKVVKDIIDGTNLEKALHRTCLVYDERMRKHKCTSNPSHPERPDRISRIYDKHKECGLAQRCKTTQPRQATPKELTLTHTSKYVQLVEGFKNYDIETLHDFEAQYNSIYLSKDVFECARLSAGCTLNVVDEVLSGQCQNGVCIVRPPGHHAERHTAMGFCYFNNVALAARYSQQKYNIKRVLIVDWDVHHGNGTQNIFEKDPSVLYISLHRHDNGGFFPAGPGGHHSQVGTGAGRGYNVNISWDGKRHGDAEYIAAFQQIVMPVAYEFAPELVLVSAGFDAARGDPLGGCRISPQGYAHLTHMLCALASGRVILVLEGGYNLTSISESMAMCTSVLLGDICPSLMLEPIIASAVNTIQLVLNTQQTFWKSLRLRVLMPSREMTQMWLAQVHSMQPDSRQHKSKTADSSVEELTKQLQKSSVSEEEPVADPLLAPVPTTSFVQLKDVTKQSQPLSGVVAESTFSNTVPLAAVLARASESGPIGTSETAPAGSSLDDEKAFDPKQMDALGKADLPLATAMEPLYGEAMTGEAHLTMESVTNIGSDVLEGACGGRDLNVDTMIRKLLGDTMAEEEILQMFAVQPRPWCPHLDTVLPVPGSGLDTHEACLECGNLGENWVCLTCYEVHCSRYVNGHMQQHSQEFLHGMCLSYADLSVWCNECEDYIHHQGLMPAKRAAHLDKFGEDLPGM